MAKGKKKYKKAPCKKFKVKGHTVYMQVSRTTGRFIRKCR